MFSAATVISRGSSPGGLSTRNGGDQQQQQLYSRINKSNSSSLIKESVANACMSDEEASLTWLQRQQKKLEERRAAQRRREGCHLTSTESNLMRELKSSLDRARSETTTDGYAASETASLLFSETSTRESSPHKQRIVPIQMEHNGFPIRTSTPKTTAPAAAASTTRPSEIMSLTRNISDTSYDRSRPLIQRRLRYDSEGEQSIAGGGGGLMNSAASHTSIDSLASRPMTPGFPNIPPTPIFGQSG